MKKYCLESRNRGISYMKYVNGRRTGLVTFQNFPGVSDLLPKASKFQHHIKLCSKCSTSLAYWLDFTCASRRASGIVHSITGRNRDISRLCNFQKRSGAGRSPVRCVPGQFPQQHRHWDVKPTTHLHLVPGLSISGAIPPLPIHYEDWSLQGHNAGRLVISYRRFGEACCVHLQGSPRKSLWLPQALNFHYYDLEEHGWRSPSNVSRFVFS